MLSAKLFICVLVSYPKRVRFMLRGTVRLTCHVLRRTGPLDSFVGRELTERRLNLGDPLVPS